MNLVQSSGALASTVPPDATANDTGNTATQPAPGLPRPSDGSTPASGTDPATAAPTAPVNATSGCGSSSETGQFYQSISSGGKNRQYYVSIPAGYNPNVAAALYVGVHGRDYDGIRMRDYLSLERHAQANENFIYPDGLRRDWGGSSAIGWQNGPMGSIYGGMEDLAFFDDMLAKVRSDYCVDSNRIFVTGQSWGGDFSLVLACYRGNTFRASVGVAANDP